MRIDLHVVPRSLGTLFLQGKNASGPKSHNRPDRGIEVCDVLQRELSCFVCGALGNRLEKLAVFTYMASEIRKLVDEKAPQIRVARLSCRTSMSAR